MLDIIQVFSSDILLIDKISIIEQNYLSEGWPKEEIISSLNNNAVYFAAVYNNEVVGHIGASFILDECYINNIVIKTEYQHIGIGSNLIKRLIDFAKSNDISFLTLEVRQSNIIAQNLYKKFGFVKQGSRKNFYTNPYESADIMTLFLK